MIVRKTLSLLVTAALSLGALSLALPAAADHHGDDPVPEITPAFDKNQTAHDPKHSPKITAPSKVKAGEWFDVTIEIGKDALHPSMDTHFIRYCLLYTYPSPRDRTRSRMPSSA